MSQIYTRSSSTLDQVIHSGITSDLRFDQQGVIEAASPALAIEITPSLAFKCGPWRVLERHGTDPAVLPPDVRQDGRWVEAVELPRVVLGAVEDAVLEAFRAEVAPDANPSGAKRERPQRASQ